MAMPVAAFGFGLAFALGGLRDALADAAPVAAFGFGPAFALGVLRGTLAVARRAGGRAGDLNVTTNGPPAAVCPVNTGGNGRGADGMAGFGSVTRAGASSTRRSGTSIRRSCQGNAKPGSPNS